VFINNIRELVAQKLRWQRDRLLYARKLCRRPASELVLRKISAGLRLNVLLNIQSVWIQDKKRNRNGGPEDYLINCNICYKKLTADHALMALRGSLVLLQERFIRKWWHWSEVEAWNFTIKTFKTCRFNENRLFICRLKSEYNCSGERPETCTFLDDASNTRSIKYI